MKTSSIFQVWEADPGGLSTRKLSQHLLLAVVIPAARRK